MILTILGAPGAGKGTLAHEISKALSIPAISTGGLLRDEIASGSETGVYIDSLISKGNFVPDDLMVIILSERLKKDDCKDGYILDGFPRNTDQASHLLDYGINLTRALLLKVSDDVIIDRLSGRRECVSCRQTYHITQNPPKKEGICDLCGSALRTRPDDKADIIKKRLQIYHKETEPLIEFFKNRNLLSEVDGTGSVSQTKKSAFEILGVEL